MAYEAPAHRELLDPHVLTRLGNLELFARYPMLGNVSGRHRSPHRGSSVEFAEYRKYVIGDDPRRLDWRAYARSDRFYIKEFEADTNLRLIFVVDCSGSMRYPTTGMSKLEYAKRLAATLSYLAIRQGDAVGVSCSGESIQRSVPARRSPAHLQAILRTLWDAESHGETGLVEALHKVADQTPQRALVTIVSDLFVPPAELQECFQHLRFRRHDVAVFHLLEKSELDFNFDRPIRFVDLEGGPRLLVEPTTIRRQYEEALHKYLVDLDQAVRDAAVDYHQIDISQPYGEVLAAFLTRRIPRMRSR